MGLIGEFIDQIRGWFFPQTPSETGDPRQNPYTTPQPQIVQSEEPFRVSLLAALDPLERTEIAKLNEANEPLLAKGPFQDYSLTYQRGKIVFGEDLMDLLDKVIGEGYQLTIMEQRPIVVRPTGSHSDRILWWFAQLMSSTNCMTRKGIREKHSRT